MGVYSLVVPFGTFWYLLVLFRTFRYLLVPSGTFQYLLVPVGTFWSEVETAKKNFSKISKIFDFSVILVIFGHFGPFSAIFGYPCFGFRTKGTERYQKVLKGTERY